MMKLTLALLAIVTITSVAAQWHPKASDLDTFLGENGFADMTYMI